MKFLGRKLRPTEPAQAESPPRIVTRQIEITVEREWISVTSQPRPGGEVQPNETKGDPLAKRD